MAGRNEAAGAAAAQHARQSDQHKSRGEGEGEGEGPPAPVPALLRVRRRCCLVWGLAGERHRLHSHWFSSFRAFILVQHLAPPLSAPPVARQVESLRALGTRLLRLLFALLGAAEEAGFYSQNQSKTRVQGANDRMQLDKALLSVLVGGGRCLGCVLRVE